MIHTLLRYAFSGYSLYSHIYGKSETSCQTDPDPEPLLCPIGTLFHPRTHSLRPLTS